MAVGIRVGLQHSVGFVAEGRLLTDVGGTLGFAVLSTPGMVGKLRFDVEVTSRQVRPSASVRTSDA